MAEAHLPVRSPEKRLYRYAIALFVMLGGLYFFTYNGHSVSGDEEILFDGVHSLALHGNLWLSYMNDDRPVGTYPGNAPVPSVDSEPMQIIASLPLFWLAQLLPGIGLIQTVWLFNILVTASTAVLLFYYAVLLGYSVRTAIIGTIVFGVATIAWPYSKVFFREPLLTLCALSSAYCLQRWRLALAAGHFRFSWLIGSIVSLAIGLATKNSALLFVPALLLIAIPKSWRQLRLSRSETVLLIVGVPLLVAGLTLITQLAAHGRYNIFGLLSSFSEVFSDILYALAGYLLSPGRSLWAFSPVLLLGLWGIARLRRQKRWREIAVPLLILFSTSVGYAFLQNRDWYGGTAWGPRYLVPIVPFVSLLIFPVIDALPTAKLWARLVSALVVILSVMVQLLGTLIPLSVFYNFLNAETVRLGLPPGTINGWQAGTWDLRYIPFTVLPRLAFNGQSDLAWLANNTPLMAMLCMLLVAGGLLVLFRPQLVGMAENQRRRAIQLRSGLLSLAFLSILFIGLYTYRTDPRFGGSDLTLRDGLAALNTRLKPGDAVLLNDRSNRLFFMNYYKSAVPIFTLPDAPGEVVVPGQQPEIVSTNLEALAPPTESTDPRRPIEIRVRGTKNYDDG